MSFALNHQVDLLYSEVSANILHSLLLSTLIKLALISGNFISFLHVIHNLFFIQSLFFLLYSWNLMILCQMFIKDVLEWIFHNWIRLFFLLYRILNPRNGSISYHIIIKIYPILFNHILAQEGLLFLSSKMGVPIIFFYLKCGELYHFLLIYQLIPYIFKDFHKVHLQFHHSFIWVMVFQSH